MTPAERPLRAEAMGLPVFPTEHLTVTELTRDDALRLYELTPDEAMALRLFAFKHWSDNT